MYDTIILNDDQWSISGEFSDDAVAGMLAALSVISPDSYLTIGSDGDYNMVEFNDDNDYLIATEQDVNNLSDYTVPRRYYGWWVIDDVDYKLYKFKTEDFAKYRGAISAESLCDFVDGFITMSEALNVDFRYLTNGLPFDSNGTEIDIEGYEIVPIQDDLEDLEQVSEYSPGTNGFYISGIPAGDFNYY